MNKQEAIREMNKTFPTEGFTALSTLVLYSGDIIDLKSKLASIINQIEPEKPAIPQFVADIIEEYKDRNAPIIDIFTEKKFNEKYNWWLATSLNAYDRTARAWLDGYEVEQEKRYTARLKLVTQNEKGYLNKNCKDNDFFIDDLRVFLGEYQTRFARSELEELNIWDNPAFEIEEVE